MNLKKKKPFPTSASKHKSNKPEVKEKIKKTPNTIESKKAFDITTLSASDPNEVIINFFIEISFQPILIMMNSLLFLAKKHVLI